MDMDRVAELISHMAYPGRRCASLEQIADYIATLEPTEPQPIDEQMSAEDEREEKARKDMEHDKEADSLGARNVAEGEAS
jgi:Asp-tRNA(Asn)/Glu-tRNA(Gln) amidotransferase C subunit